MRTCIAEDCIRPLGPDAVAFWSGDDGPYCREHFDRAEDRKRKFNKPKRLGLVGRILAFFS